MSESQDSVSDDLPADEFHTRGAALETEDEVLVNDRKRALTVVGKHEREPEKSYQKRKHGSYTVIELEGNGTEYHLITWNDANYGPMLYKKADWELVETPTGEEKYQYPRGGERVEKLDPQTNTESQ